MESILRFAQGRLSIATIEQLAAIPLLVDHKKYVEKVRKEYQLRRDIVIEELRKIPGVEAVSPKGAFYIMPKLPIDNSDRFASFLLEKFSHQGETVMIAPATGFYKSDNMGREEIRIAYVLQRAKLKKAMKLLAMAIEKYNKNKR